MATSGTTVYSLDVAQVMDEAWERCGLDPAKLELRHFVAAQRSLNLLLQEWANGEINLWAVEDLQSLSLTAGTASYSLPTGVLDVVAAVLRRDGEDIPLGRMGRDDYLATHNKTDQGRPTSFYVDRKVSGASIYLWRAPENSTDTVIYSALTTTEAVTALSETLDVPQQVQDAVAAGLAKRLALKFAPDRYVVLGVEAKAAYELAKNGFRDRADTAMRLG